MAFGGFFGGGSSSSNNDDSSSSSSSTSSPSSSSSSNSMYPTVNFGGAPASSNDIRSRLQTAITTEGNIINAKFLIEKINENCFDHCVPDPQSSLSSKESACLSTCMEKYIEAWNVTSKTYVGRLQREGANLGGMMGAQGAGGAPGGKEMF